jgi:UrcA family protein
MKSVFLIGLFAAIAASPVHAFADAPDRTVVVRYDDLDLGTANGRVKLQSRIKRAVRRVCEVPGPVSVEAQDRIAACVEQAWKNAAPEIEVALGSDSTVLGEQAAR